jgi:hypothetical protein
LNEPLGTFPQHSPIENSRKPNPFPSAEIATTPELSVEQNIVVCVPRIEVDVQCGSLEMSDE